MSTGGSGGYTAEVAAEVRAMMARRNVKGQTLAAALGVSGAYVSRRLHGAAPWSVDDLAVVADVLRCDVQDLLPAVGGRAIRTDHRNADHDGVPSWTVGDRLRKAREHAGLEQGQMAEAIGVSRNSVINYEKGHTAPRLIVLRAWASATGVSVAWLESGSGDE